MSKFFEDQFGIRDASGRNAELRFRVDETATFTVSGDANLGLAAAVTFTDPVVPVTTSGVKVYAGAVSALTLVSGAILPNVRLYIVIPANTVSSTLTLPTEWLVFTESGYTFNPTLDTLIELETMSGGGTKIRGTLSQSPVIDAGAPAVSSAAAAGSALTVVFTKPVYVASLQGLGLAYTTGTARTIASVTSGNGTNTVVFALSGATSSTDVATLVVNNTNQITGIYSTALPTSSTAVSFGASVPTTGLLLHWSSRLQSAEGMAIGTRVTDFGPAGTNHGAQQGGVTITGSGASAVFDYSAADNCGINSSVAYPTSTYTVVGRLAKKDATNWLGATQNVFFGNTTAASQACLPMFWSNTSGLARLVHNASPQDLGTLGLSAWVDLAWHLVVLRYDTAVNTVELFIDDMVTPAFSTTSYTFDPTAANFAAGVWGITRSFRHLASNWLLYSVALDQTARTQLAAALA